MFRCPHCWEMKERQYNNRFELGQDTVYCDFCVTREMHVFSLDDEREDLADTYLNQV